MQAIPQKLKASYFTFVRQPWPPAHAFKLRLHRSIAAIFISWLLCPADFQNEAVFLSADTECHHIVVEDWDKMEDPGGCLFVSMPSLLDPSLCPEGTHLVHIFTPDWIHNWEVHCYTPYPVALSCIKSKTVQSRQLRRVWISMVGVYRNIFWWRTKSDSLS